MKSQCEIKKGQCKEGSSSKPRPTFAKTGSEKGMSKRKGEGNPPQKKGEAHFCRAMRENPLLKATCGHTATAHIRKDRSQVWQGQTGPQVMFWETTLRETPAKPEV